MTEGRTDGVIGCRDRRNRRRPGLTGDRVLQAGQAGHGHGHGGKPSSPRMGHRVARLAFDASARGGVLSCACVVVFSWA